MSGHLGNFRSALLGSFHPALTFVALGGLLLAVLGAAAIHPQRASMNKLLAIGAIAATLGLPSLHAEAQTRGLAAGVRPVASYSAPTAGQDSTASAGSANRAGGQKCWYVLDVLLCD